MVIGRRTITSDRTYHENVIHDHANVMTGRSIPRYDIDRAKPTEVNMTRKDYAVIADIIRSLAPNTHGPLSNADYQAIVDRFAEGFRARFVNFDIKKFRATCE